MAIQTRPKPAIRLAGATHRRRDVQGLRAIAIVSVVVYHAGLGLPGGFVGVDIFFVISGYVISGLLLREIEARGTVSLRAFYMRRARRLLPALAVVTVVTLALSAVLLSPIGTAQRGAGEAASAASIFSANTDLWLRTGGYFQPVAATNPFLHTWSLSAEEQFYILFPAVLILGWLLSRRRRGRPLVALILTIFAISLFADLAFSFNWFPHTPGFRGLSPYPAKALGFAFYSPVTRAWEFLAGVLVALLSRPAARRGVGQVAGVVGGALLLGSVLFLHSADTFPGYLAALPVAGTALLIYAGRSVRTGWATRALSVRPLVALGDLSYSWYLWHWPAIVFAMTWYPAQRSVWVAAAAASLIPAGLSYRFFEAPIHQRRRLISARATAAMALACIVIPALGGLALVTAWKHSWARPGIAAIQSAVTPEHIDQVRHCASTEPLGSLAHPPCIWTSPHAKGTILLIGDSNAGHLSEPLIAAARRLDMDLQIATDGGCPFVQHFSATGGCAGWAASSLASILRRRVAYTAVVISNASVAYLDPVHFSGGARAGAIRSWAQDMQRTVARISQRSPVLVIGAVPKFTGLPNCLVPSILRTHPATSCGHETPAAARLQRAPIVSAERTALKGLDASYYDTASRLCDAAGACDSHVKGTLVYRDGSHLTVAGSLLFTGDLQRSLSALTASRAGPLQ